MIAIIDFGSQTSQLIARRVRECNVFSEVFSPDIDVDCLIKKGVRGIILSGGPASTLESGSPKCSEKIFSLGLPILGICYGMQVIAQHFGATLAAGEIEEYGKSRIAVTQPGLLFSNTPPAFDVWMSHGDSLVSMPRGFAAIASTQTLRHAAIADEARQIYALQFHPEVSHTEYGSTLIKNFVLGVCRAPADWTMEDFVATSITHIRETVGDKRVLLALSGGVDSTTLAVLLHKAIGSQLSCIFIDNGYMREGEPEAVRAMIGEHLGITLIMVDAAEQFYAALAGVVDPEEKRKRIGLEFVHCFETASQKIEQCAFLAQGTLYPDVIESGGFSKGHVTHAVTIKTHHNVGGLPQNMQFTLLEPLRMLFKDEVRALARQLKIHNSIINRQPFPGPGLAIRILGEANKACVTRLRQADRIVQEEIGRWDNGSSLWQAFAVLLPIHTVGVMGDRRTYSQVIALRAVTSEDAMTAHWAHLPYEVLESISSRIINEVENINRVVYDISSKPPSTIEWE